MKHWKTLFLILILVFITKQADADIAADLAAGDTLSSAIVNAMAAPGNSVETVITELINLGYSTEAIVKGLIEANVTPGKSVLEDILAEGLSACHDAVSGAIDQAGTEAAAQVVEAAILAGCDSDAIAQLAIDKGANPLLVAAAVEEAERELIFAMILLDEIDDERRREIVMNISPFQ